jgi:hypothetical protein
MIDEELIKYEMQAHAIAEHQHAKAIAKRQSIVNLQRDSSGHLGSTSSNNIGYYTILLINICFH